MSAQTPKVCDNGPMDDLAEAISVLEESAEFHYRMAKWKQIILLARVKLRKRMQSGELTYEQARPYLDNLREEDEKFISSLESHRKRLEQYIPVLRAAAQRAEAKITEDRKRRKATKAKSPVD